MDRSCHEGICDPPPLRILNWIGSALLVLLFVRLLHDPHIPPKLYWLSWLAALTVMARIGCHGGQWLTRVSPAALPSNHGMGDVAAKNAVWVLFGIGLPMAVGTTLALLARLLHPGGPPPHPGPPPAPPPGPEFLELLHHGMGHGQGPGIFLGMAMVFVPTAVLCLALAPWARHHLKSREAWGPLDGNALMAGVATVGYSLLLITLMREPGLHRLQHDLVMMLSPKVLPNHALASAVAFGVWKLWFGCKACRPGPPAPEPPTEAAGPT